MTQRKDACGLKNNNSPFAVIKLAQWEAKVQDGQDVDDSLTGQSKGGGGGLQTWLQGAQYSDLQLSPASGIVAALKEIDSEGGCKEKHIELLTTFQGKLDVKISLEGPCDTFSWISSNVAIAAKVFPDTKELGLYLHCLCIEHLEESFSKTSEELIWKDSWHGQVYKLDKYGTYQLQGSSSKCKNVKGIKTVKSDLHSSTSCFVVEHHHNSDSVLSFKIFQKHFISYPLLSFPGQCIVNISTEDEFVAVIVYPNLLYIWHMKDIENVWHQKLSVGKPNRDRIVALNIQSTKRKLLVAVGTEKGHVFLFEPNGIYSCKRKPFVIQEDGNGIPHRVQEAVQIEKNFCNEFDLNLKRAIVSSCKSTLHDLTFYGNALICTHVDEEKQSKKAFRLFWHDTSIQLSEANTGCKGEIMIENGIIVFQSSHLIAFIDQHLIFNCIVPSRNYKEQVKAYGSHTLFSALPHKMKLQHYQDLFPFIVDILEGGNVESASTFIRLNGTFKDNNEMQLLLILEAVMSRFDMALLDKLVTCVVNSKPFVWIAMARFILMKLFQSSWAAKGRLTLAKFSNILMKCIKEAHYGSKKSEALQLSTYMSILRSIETSTETKWNNKSRKSVESPLKVGVTSFQDKYNLLEEGILNGEMARTLYQLLQEESLQNSSMPKSERNKSDVRIAINGYLIHLLQKAEFAKFSLATRNLDIQFRSTLEYISLASINEGIRSKATSALHDRKCLDPDLLRIVYIIQNLKELYINPNADTQFERKTLLDYGNISQVSNSSSTGNLEQNFQVELQSKPDLSLALKIDGVLGNLWPKTLYIGTFDSEQSRTFDSEPLMPIVFAVDWDTDVVQKLKLEGILEFSSTIPDHMTKDEWGSVLSFSCEHHMMDMVPRLLEFLPDEAHGQGQLKILLPSQYKSAELTMQVFMPTLPLCLSSLLQNTIDYGLAKKGIARQLYWPSALPLIALFEKTNTSRNILACDGIGNPANVQANIANLAKSFFIRQKLANFALLYSRIEGDQGEDDEVKRWTWCNWLPITQKSTLKALSCAINASIVRSLDVQRDECGMIEQIEGIGNLSALPLLAFEPCYNSESPFLNTKFWKSFKMELTQNTEFLEHYPTLASFLKDKSNGKNEVVDLMSKQDLFVALRNMMFTSSNHLSLIASNYPPQMPYWIKKLLHLSTSIRFINNESISSTSSLYSNEKIAETFLAKEREVEKYIENEFFVLPFESSDLLCIQNHIQHGRSFAALYACLKSSSISDLVEDNDIKLEVIDGTNEFVCLERYSYTSALADFQNETVVSACVLTLQLIQKDPYSLQMNIAVLRYVTFCIDSGLFTYDSNLSVDFMNNGFDMMTPIIQSICDDISRGFVLDSNNEGIYHLHRILTSILDKQIADSKDNISEAALTDVGLDRKSVIQTVWILLNAFNECYGFAPNNIYLEYLAFNNDWVHLLAEVESHRYSIEEVMSFASFANKELQAHIERALLPRVVFNDKILSSSNEGPMHPPELFSIISSAEKDQFPGSFLLDTCLKWRWPFLAVLASCFDDVEKVSCIEKWILTTCFEDIESYAQYSNNIVAIIETLCTKKCYLPLIRAGEIFYSRSPFVTFMYFLHSFMQTQFANATAYLTQYKDMVAIKSEDLDHSHSVDWMSEACIIALDSSLCSELSNTFERTKAMEIISESNLLHLFPQIERVKIVYDILGEGIYSKYVNWCTESSNEVVTQSHLSGPPFVDIKGAVKHLEDQNRWKDARLMYQRCGLNLEDIVFEHAQRLLLDFKSSECIVEGNIGMCWKDCHDLFIESPVSPARVGAFFVKEFNDSLGQIKLQYSYKALELSFRWYKGQFLGTACAARKVLDEIMFQGLICSHILHFEKVDIEEEKHVGEKWYIDSENADIPDSNSLKGKFMLHSIEYHMLMYYLDSKVDVHQFNEKVIEMLIDTCLWYGEVKALKELHQKQPEMQDWCYIEGLSFLLHTLGDDVVSKGHLLEKELHSNLQKISSESDFTLPHSTERAIKLLCDKISHRSGKEFAKRFWFAFRLSSVLHKTPKSILSIRLEEMLQLLLRNGPDFLKFAEEFVDIYYLPSPFIAPILVNCYFKGLLISHRGDLASSLILNEPTYSTEEFENCSYLCSDKAELGHALLNIILTKHHLPAEFEVEVIILAHYFYENAHAMDGVDVITTLALDRISMYASTGEFKTLIRLVHGFGQRSVLQFALDKLIEHDKIELLLQKRTLDNNSKISVSQRGLKREILLAICRSSGSDSQDLLMAKQHFNKSRSAALSLQKEAELILEEQSKSDNVSDLTAALLLSEAANIYENIGCVNKAYSCASKANTLVKGLH